MGGADSPDDGRFGYYDSLLDEQEYTPELKASMQSALEPYMNATDGFVVLTQSSRVGSDGMPRGYVARVYGTMPLLSRANPFVTSRLGRGVSWFPIERVDDEAALRASVGSKTLPRTAAMSDLTVHVAKSTDGLFDEPEYFVIVHGNDASTSKQLLDSIERGAADGKPLTVGDVAESREYANLLQSSSDARIAIAGLFASQHGLALRHVDGDDGDTIVGGSVLTHSLSVPTHSENPSVDSSIYDVYEDVVNPTKARAGVPVYMGALAGYVLLRGSRDTAADGRVTRAIHSVDPTTDDYKGTPLLHANTGLHARGNAPRKSALHQDTNDGMRVRAAESLFSLGPIPDVNPSIVRKFNVLDDDAGIRALSAMGIRLTGSNAVDRRALRTIVAELPGIDTRDMSLGQLAAVAAKTKVDRLPVRIHGDVIARLQRNWPAVRAAQSDYSKLGKTLKHESDDGTVALSTSLVRTLAKLIIEKGAPPA